jgi:hypothetical protein
MLICFFVNGSVPRFDAGQIDYESLGEAIACQSDLLYFFSFSALPIKIMNALVNEGVPLGSAGRPAGKHVPQKQTDRHGNASSDYSLSRTEKSGIKMIKSGSVFRTISPLQRLCQAESPPGPVAVTTSCLRCRSAHFALLVVAVFFLLPRSSINEDASMRPSNNRIRPGVSLAGFFFCPGHP